MERNTKQKTKQKTTNKLEPKCESKNETNSKVPNSKMRTAVPSKRRKEWEIREWSRDLCRDERWFFSVICEWVLQGSFLDAVQSYTVVLYMSSAALSSSLSILHVERGTAANSVFYNLQVAWTLIF